MSKSASGQVCKSASGQVGRRVRPRVRSIVWALAVVVGLVVLVGTAGCGGSDSPEALVEERCTGCHALTIVKTASKTRAEWEETGDRMIEKGTRLNERQAQEVIDYLSETYGAEAQ